MRGFAVLAAAAAVCAARQSVLIRLAEIKE
jgi:hypothetical protein